MSKSTEIFFAIVLAIGAFAIMIVSGAALHQHATGGDSRNASIGKRTHGHTADPAHEYERDYDLGLFVFKK